MRHNLNKENFCISFLSIRQDNNNINKIFLKIYFKECFHRFVFIYFISSSSTFLTPLSAFYHLYLSLKLKFIFLLFVSNDLSRFWVENYINFSFRQKNGTFIEAGAFDGEKLSNTLILERELGWTGLLIEPNPINYKNIPHKHRRAHYAQCCLSLTTRASNMSIRLYICYYLL